ncbi:hypothetical protein ARMSODRAFT_961302 [Armillaria solidipes]|uniref:Uncharacterized protein n=1 Tax=Armillaria solidipes TaxID=1076256 RepID=A0A2H3B6K3_9AGAR|nr:hypothetical protein ARMSODRAFT_961302 [Armillaria solidipes]
MCLSLKKLCALFIVEKMISLTILTGRAYMGAESRFESLAFQTGRLLVLSGGLLPAYLLGIEARFLMVAGCITAKQAAMGGRSESCVSP